MTIEIYESSNSGNSNSYEIFKGHIWKYNLKFKKIKAVPESQINKNSYGKRNWKQKKYQKSYFKFL